MNAAIIVMTILGCDDSAVNCHYIETASQRWPTIAMCDAVSEERLPNYANQPYPVIIAVCQDPETAGLSPEPGPAKAASGTESVNNQTADSGSSENATDAEVTPEQAETLAGRAIQRVRNVLPSTEGVKTLMSKPVRLVEGGYSWVARRFDR